MSQSRIVPQPSNSADQPRRGQNVPAQSQMPTITCQICQAVYTPAEEYQYLAQAPQIALESAFMSMCHFCFRCRRPACPQCWDNVHGVCGECSQETRLPFRAQVAPLRGVLFSDTRQAQLKRKQVELIRLRCISPGRFQMLAPIDEAETSPLLRKAIPGIDTATRPAPPSSSTKQGQDNNSTTAQRKYPTIAPRSYPQQYSSTQIPLHPTQLIAQAERSSEDNTIPTQPPRTSTRITKKIAAGEPSPKKQRITKKIASSRSIEERPYQKIDEEAIPIREEYTTSTEESTKRVRKKAAVLDGQFIEVLVTYILTAIIIGILVLITLAMTSPAANILIRQLLHIDIPGELHNLWQLMFP